MKTIKEIRHRLGNVKRFFSKFVLLLDANICQKKINNKILLLKNKEKIKVAFLHMYATDCQNLCIFEAMINSDFFDPYFIVNPDVFRSYDNLIFQYNRTIKNLKEKYGSERVICGYDTDTKVFFDFTKDFDLMTTNNPYDIMAHKYFTIKYWGKRGIPVFYISYFYMGRCKVTEENFRLPQFNYIWKIFVENNSTVEIARKTELLKGKNVVLSGYPKLDEYYKLKDRSNGKKIVILAPHHTINDSATTSTGSFLEYYDILKRLPGLFPDLFFVFRPHPLLFENLKQYWNKEEIDNWLNEFLMNKNTSYSTEGNYLQLFKDSTALIHDCGSYAAEYMYTGKPCAFMYKKSFNLGKSFTPFGKECIENHYALKTESDFIKFIQEVVIGENDIRKIRRLEFANDKVMVNYPNATVFIMDDIKSTIL